MGRGGGGGGGVNERTVGRRLSILPDRFHCQATKK